jgi:molybdenum cofactor cytidylyltransferase
MDNPELSVLIPAAGASKRLGQAKQLVRYKGLSLIQNAVIAAQSITPREIIVVTGAEARAVQNSVETPSVRWIHNPLWSAGLGGSIALGAGVISPQSTGLIIFLCDQWRLQAQDLIDMADKWQSDRARIVCAQAGGHCMPPVIFPVGCFKQLQELQGKHGAQTLFKKHPDILTPVPLENAAFDLDTQAHLDKLKKSPG